MTNSQPSRFNDSLSRFAQILSQTELQQIQAIQSQPLAPGIRLNVLKGKPEQIIQSLSARYNWQVKPIPFCKNAWQIQKTEFPPGKTIEHRLGQYYLQDSASMIPVSLMDFENDPLLVLDMAASPGGKTTHLIDQTGDRGFIIANDGSRGRIPALRAVLSAWGGINNAITNFPGEFFGDWFPETFSHVLLDAPCSMENLRPVPNRPQREITAAERNRLQERQVQLLTSGLKALRIGGQLVYATCSLAIEEDEAVLDRVIQQFPDTFTIDDISERMPFKAPGLLTYGKETFHMSLTRSLRLWPHITGMSGFYCARLTKTKTILSERKEPPSREFSRTSLTPMLHHQQNQIIKQMWDDYGLDLQQILNKYNLELWNRNEKLFLLPGAYLSQFSFLPFEYLGMLLGVVVSTKFQPSFEFISRFGHTFTKGTIQLSNHQVQQWIEGHDIRAPITPLKPQGQYLMVTDEEKRNLGLGKLLAKRLRNMLPRGSI